ncbi:unnamed protein product [Bursaphelenchus xylophilus]|uniref:(pine wood nematode) hypothetical protein n=1 Tax=Bursaphelenchus xylophilus TaxID=6326 RepID=A0A1I7SMS6_BURXY|nr:unnamed protein product [Bursaphelenchus xylophilus]CAG9130347.1 unnamed protein product [Bursaphelenchus xylophilus]
MMRSLILFLFGLLMPVLLAKSEPSAGGVYEFNPRDWKADMSPHNFYRFRRYNVFSNDKRSEMEFDDPRYFSTAFGKRASSFL